jgi:O-antigen/teichoic acid export membrane protein
MVVALGILTLLSRYLGPHEFGQYQLVIAFLLLLNLSDLGIATIAARHLSTGERDPNEVMGNVLLIRAALAALSTALTIGVAWAADYSTKETTAIAVASLSFPFMLFSSTYAAIFVARLRMEYAALGNIAQSLTSLALMSAVAFSGGGLIRMLIAYDIGFLANSAVCLYFARKFVGRRSGSTRHDARDPARRGSARVAWPSSRSQPADIVLLWRHRHDRRTTAAYRAALFARH